jgi:hypothetical protein
LRPCAGAIFGRNTQALANHAKSFVGAIVIAIAIVITGSARRVRAEDASGAGPDANWEAVTNPNSDATDQVLEIPQACTNDGVAVPCDESASAPKPAHDSSDGDDDDEDDIQTAGGPLGHPTTFDEDTANAAHASTDPSVGSVDEYESEPSYVAVPYGSYVVVPNGGYGIANARPGLNGTPSPLPPSAYTVPPMAMSAPVTQAARPPLNPGPWMTPPSMSAFSRPAGSPMTGYSFRSR